MNWVGVGAQQQGRGGSAFAALTALLVQERAASLH